MEGVIYEFDEHGELVFQIDYEKEGDYILIRGSGDFNSKVIKRSKSVRTLIEHVAHTFENTGDPQVEISDSAEVIYALEVTNGKDVFDEDCEQDENY